MNNKQTNSQDQYQFIILEGGVEGKQPGIDKALARPPRRPVSNIPKITIPYPPEITALELITKAKVKKTATKSPNKFLIYRKAYVKELYALGIQCSMTDISKNIAESWKKEPKYVRDAYREISDEANRLHKQMIGVPNMKKKNNRKKSSNKSSSIPMNAGYTSSLSVTVSDNYTETARFQQHPPPPPQQPYIPPECYYTQQQNMIYFLPSYNIVPGISN